MAMKLSTIIDTIRNKFKDNGIKEPVLVNSDSSTAVTGIEPCASCKFGKELVTSNKTCEAGKNMGRAIVSSKCKYYSN